jgi:hypothetical protein
VRSPSVGPVRAALDTVVRAATPPHRGKPPRVQESQGAIPVARMST